MITTKSVTREIGELRGLGELVTTYEFIAAAAMRRIRNSVLENRAFHLGLNAIFQEIKRAYEREMHALAQHLMIANPRSYFFPQTPRSMAMLSRVRFPLLSRKRKKRRRTPSSSAESEGRFLRKRFLRDRAPTLISRMRQSRLKT